MSANLMENDQYLFCYFFYSVQKLFKSFLIQQEHIQLIRSDSKDMYNVTKHHFI